MRLVWYIHVLRFLVLFISLIAFICHLSQCLLLNAYQEKTGIPDWLTAGHWQYLTWYISLCLSLVGSFAVCTSAFYLKNTTKYSLDKSIGSLVILPVLASIITDTLFESIEPWTDGHVKVERSSLLNSCYLLDSSRDKFYPMLYQRCMLSDTTWICAVFLCINWVILVGLNMFISRKSTVSSKVAAGEEPKWGRYIPDPPSSIYSATTLGNRSGLLTPSSTLTREKHNEFYYNCAYNRDSIPREYPPDYLSKGGDFFGSKSYDYDSCHDNGKSSSAYYYYGDRSPSPSHYYRKYSSNFSGNELYYGSSGKRGEDDDEEQDKHEYTHNRQTLLTVNTGYHTPSPPSEKEPESATTLTTPLYSKFSSKSPIFDISSDKKYSSYY